MTDTNREVVRVLRELAELTEIDEGSPNAFRVRAYQNAERAVATLQRDIADLTASELAQIKGIGKSIAARIRQFIDTGTIDKLEELRAKHPTSKVELLKVPGIGPKTVQLLEDELGITDLEGLVEGLHDGSVATLPGMGERSVANLLDAIDKLGLTSKDARVPIVDALPTAERLVAALAGLPGVEQAAYAGSLRRFRETIGDLDLLVAATEAAPVTAAFLQLSDVDRELGSGGTKTSVITRDQLQVDLRVVPPESFGAALLYFTGSKAHNIRLRQRAIQRGWTLNEYHLAEQDSGKVIASQTEEEIYQAIGLPWIAPEQREDNGEIEAARDGVAPTLVEVADLRGDLHTHTDLSGDGRDPLEELVAAAAARGLDYLAITDHAENLTINGVSREQMLQQRRELRELEQARGDLRLLHGSELNIGVDGSLDYDDEFLAGFDWLVASVHSHFNRSVEEQTARVVAAIRHPSVTAIGHLTGRMMGKRAGIDLDLEAVFDAAAETGTAIEINASLRRLDAPVEAIREGARRGVHFVISTDSHGVDDLDRARFGAAQARRAGLERELIANTWPTERFFAWVEQVRG